MECCQDIASIIQENIFTTPLSIWDTQLERGVCPYQSERVSLGFPSGDEREHITLLFIFCCICIQAMHN